MKRTTNAALLQVAACIAMVIAMGVTARHVALAAWNSVVQYRSPYDRFHPALPAGPRLADRVILVTIDGLRLDTSRRLPFLNQLRRQGADAVARVGLPSLSNPGRAVMVSGAWADVNGITSNSSTSPVLVDSVPSLARRAGLRSVVAGSKFWQRNLGRYFDQTLLVREDLPPHADVETIKTAQRRACKASLDFINTARFDFAAVDYLDGDEVSHDFGGQSPEAQQLYEVIDGCLAQLVASLDLSRTTLIVTSDHGHLSKGGHGGDEPDVLTVPLVLAGARVSTFSPLPEGSQADIAPTICALLGLRQPATSEGTILINALDLSVGQKDELRGLQARQKELLQAFQARLWGGSLETAQARGRAARWPVALALAALFLGLLLWLFFRVFSGGERLPALLALLVFAGCYALLFWLAGLRYSLSAVNKEAYLGSFFLKDMLIGATALLAAAGVLGLAAPARGLAAVRLGAAFSLLAAIGAAAYPLFAYWRYGLRMAPWLPPFDRLFAVYLDLLVLFAFCFAAWPAMLLVWLTSKTHRGEDQEGHEAESSAI